MRRRGQEPELQTGPENFSALPIELRMLKKTMGKEPNPKQTPHYRVVGAFSTLFFMSKSYLTKLLCLLGEKRQPDHSLALPSKVRVTPPSLGCPFRLNGDLVALLFAAKSGLRNSSVQMKGIQI